MRFFIASILIFSFSDLAQAADKQRGKLLYENHCIQCHESTLHVRKKSKVKAKGDLNYWIARWAKAQDLAWTDKEFEDVKLYLDESFYHFSAPKHRN